VQAAKPSISLASFVTVAGGRSTRYDCGCGKGSGAAPQGWGRRHPGVPLRHRGGAAGGCTALSGAQYPRIRRGRGWGRVGIALAARHRVPAGRDASTQADPAISSLNDDVPAVLRTHQSQPSFTVSDRHSQPPVAALSGAATIDVGGGVVPAHPGPPKAPTNAIPGGECLTCRRTYLAAVGVVDRHDLGGAEQPLPDRQRADDVIGHDIARVADDVRVTPRANPSTRCGSRRASMRATTATWRAGGSGKRPGEALRVGGVCADQFSRSVHQ
jgi:hypothetical protein